MKSNIQLRWRSKLEVSQFSDTSIKMPANKISRHWVITSKQWVKGWGLRGSITWNTSCNGKSLNRRPSMIPGVSTIITWNDPPSWCFTWLFLSENLGRASLSHWWISNLLQHGMVQSDSSEMRKERRAKFIDARERCVACHLDSALPVREQRLERHDNLNNDWASSTLIPERMCRSYLTIPSSLWCRTVKNASVGCGPVFNAARVPWVPLQCVTRQAVRLQEYFDEISNWRPKSTNPIGSW